MREPSVHVEGRTGFMDGGPVRGVRVRARDEDEDAASLVMLAMVFAGLIGVVFGIAGSDPSLVLGWLS